VIPARKGGPWAAVLSAYARSQVRGAFRALWLRGPPLPDGRGLLVYVNHTSFWDGFLIHALCQLGRWDGHALMDEAQLQRYRFLSRLGGFSVRRGDPSSALESLRYARDLLRRGATVFVFPEGVMLPGPLRPFERGVEVLARAAQCRCLPVAIRCGFFDDERPDALVEVGSPHGPEPLDGFQRRMAALCDRLAEVRQLDGFQQGLTGKAGARVKWDRFRRQLRQE
jgi:1-acyl-sn-glycerol-3-phosphate acyltransferase